VNVLCRKVVKEDEQRSTTVSLRPEVEKVEAVLRTPLHEIFLSLDDCRWAQQAACGGRGRHL